MIQSFVPGEVTPQQAHEIGQKLASEILGGEYAYVLATHCDRDHIHNHFVWCAVNMVTHKKYVSNKATYHKIQDVSDQLCAEYSLSVITEKSGRSGKSYSEYQADKYGTSWKTLLRRTMDAAIHSSSTYDGFLKFMTECKYEIKQSKYISFRAAGQERFTRAKTVGENYTEERIRERIAMPKPMPIIQRGEKPSVGTFVDRTDDNVRLNPGYNQWASLHNLHTTVDTVNYLARNHDFDLAEFERKYAECIAKRDAIRSEFDRTVQRVMGDAALGIIGRIRKHDELRSKYDRDMKALNTEIAELERVRGNVKSMYGENFYNKHSQRGREVSL